jgi:chromosome segregation ATPase
MTFSKAMLQLSASLGLTLSLSAHAGQIGKDRDWVLTDHATPTGSVCVAATSVKVQKANYRLEVQRAKSKTAATEIMIREMSYGYGMTGFLTNKDVSGIMLAIPKLEETADSRFFWMVPTNTDAILKGLAAGKELRVYAVNPTREIKYSFSPKGFAKMLTLMQEKCTGGGDLFNTAFEQEFLKGLAVDRDPSGLDLVKTRALRDVFFRGASIFDQKLASNAEIQKLVNQYASLINEGTALEQSIAELNGSTIPSIQRAQVNNQSEKVKMERDLEAVKKEIPILEAALKASQKVYDSAYDAIKPHLDEHANLSSTVDSAENKLLEWERYLSSLRSQIATKERQVAQLESELRNLRDRIAYNESELSRADRIAEERRRDYERFDIDREVRERLRDNTEMPHLKNQLELARGQLPNLRQDIGQKQTIATAAQTSLRECQRTPDSDCSAQQAEAARAQNDLNEANQKLKAVEQDILQTQNRIRAIEDSIERRVRSEKDELENKYDRAVANRNAISREITQDRADARQIRDFDIPLLDREIADLEADIPGAQSGITDSEAALTNAKASLASFEKRVGWVAKKQNLDRATADRDQKQTLLSNAVYSKGQLERGLINNESERVRLVALLSDAQVRLSTAQARLADVNNQLVPYKQERSRLDEVAVGIQAMLDQQMQAFRQNL